MIAFHPLANIFPLIEGAEFDELVADVKANGLREPVVLFEGAVLDGRNRLRACNAAQVEPSTKTFTGTDPLAFVISANLRRRHLKETQRALIAARIANMARGRRTDLARHDGKISLTEAAQMLNVAVRTVQYGRRVQQHAIPELLGLVEKGKVSISAAANVASTLNAVEQRELVKKGRSAIVARARKVQGLRGRQGRAEYSVLWRCVDRICDALESRRLDKADLAASELRRELARVASDRRAK